MTMKIFLAVLGLLVLGACASLTENECARGDWYGIGLRDGANGQLLTYFGQHVKACSKHGITPQETPWREGRERGLRLYCTPENAYDIGRRGLRPNPVCTAGEAADMSRPNAVGREYYAIGQDIAAVEQDIRDVDASLAGIGDTDPTLAARLYRERARLELELLRLKRRQARYATWP